MGFLLLRFVFLHELIDSETANAFFHDVAGWLMMPLALAMLGIELKVLGHLFIDLPAPVRPARTPVARFCLHRRGR